MANRREKFRQYMVRLNAAAPPGDAIKEGLYVPRPGRSAADQIVSRLELEPASSHLLVGGVGSGKTTQLLVARNLLKNIPDVQAFFIDVSQKHDLGKLQSGVLLVLAGLTLGRFVTDGSTAEVKKAQKLFNDWAHGWIEWVDDVDDYWEPPDDLEVDSRVPIRHKGVLVPPQPPLRWDIKQKTEQLNILQQEATQHVRHIVLLFDSLDRVANLAPFAELVEQDIRAIRSIGIGVIVVGPLRTMFATDRPIAERFDYFYHQPSVDVQQDTTGQEFLIQVLRRRAEKSILPDKPLRRIVELSGGVLRDLISLARAAGEEAYTAGADVIEVSHVESSADAFGRTLMLGLDADEIEVLQRVRTQGTFVPTSDKDIALLLTRRVLEYGNGRMGYAVHPTIAPLLEQLAISP